MIEEFVPRFGLPRMIDFRTDEERFDYARAAQKIRDSLPAGACVVSPRCGLVSFRGRVLESGASVSASDFGEGETGRHRLEEHIFDGTVLKSERQSDEEIAEIAAHVQRVRAINAAFVGDTPAAKLDRLLEQNK